LCCFAWEEGKVWKRKWLDLFDLYYLHMLTQYTIWLPNGLVCSQHMASTKVTKVLSTLTIFEYGSVGFEFGLVCIILVQLHFIWTTNTLALD
jgi:hypothetical protein